MRTSISLVAAAIALAACTQDKLARQMPTTPSGVAPTELSAYVAASNPSPVLGDNVTLYVRALRGSSVGAIGSFTLRVAYDSTRLRFTDALRSDQGMVMTNSTHAGTLVAAGASSTGFKTDELVAARFTVIAPNALDGVTLTVSELNSIGFQDQRAQMRVERSVYSAGVPAGARR